MERRSGKTHSGARVPAAAGGGAGAEGVRPGKPIRLVAIDLDGTLLSSRKTITRATHTALKAALKKGVKVVLATARPPRSVRAYYEGLGLDTPTINYNGALIWDELRRKAIEHVPLEAEMARKVIAWGRGRYPELLVSVEILDKWYTDHFSDVPEFMTETARQFTPDFVGPIEAFLRVPITKLMLLGKPSIVDELERQFPKKFGGQVAQTRSDPHMLQLMSPRTSKALALAHVAKLLGIEAAEVMAMGDAPNDVDMLKWAGLAVAPENGWETVRQMADVVVASNDADGVAEALKRFVLG